MKALSAEIIEKELTGLDDWEFEDDKISKKFEFGNFKEALSFMVRVGFEAEEQAHHPEWFNVYNRVEISLSTHDAGNKVTEKDIHLAKAIEAIAN
ncbi:MAG: 4a-hydroxytetrahydrobiopterin dehydratase [Balneolaceae bacterium]|nr:MAG: 4a-hydroxytetrahydrobiopterin dehydratase [Balneolaceae bacterium]